jgi:hypothetical protein
MFGAASALRVALFAPMFVASVIATIIAAASLFKYLMEGDRPGPGVLPEESLLRALPL